MKKFFAVVVGFLALTAVAASAQSGLADIQKMVREQEAMHATVALALLHMDITHATGQALRAFEAYQSMEKKVRKISDDPAVSCVQIPGLAYRQILRETETSAAYVVTLMSKAPTMIEAGAVPSEGMRKFIDSGLSELMQVIAADSKKLQALFSNLETFCAKKG